MTADVSETNHPAAEDAYGNVRISGRSGPPAPRVPIRLIFFMLGFVLFALPILIFAGGLTQPVGLLSAVLGFSFMNAALIGWAVRAEA